MNLQSNDFELFGLTQQFAQDRAALDARWKDLQREAHPDKFAAQGDAAQRAKRLVAAGLVQIFAPMHLLHQKRRRHGRVAVRVDG